MKYILKYGKHYGKSVDAFVEVVKERIGRAVIMSEIREPTEEDLLHFSKEKCCHSTQKEQLVYDELGAIYDMRFCAVCGEYLGSV